MLRRSFAPRNRAYPLSATGNRLFQQGLYKASIERFVHRVENLFREEVSLL
jgi:hypothetical protein